MNAQQLGQYTITVTLVISAKKIIDRPFSTSLSVKLNYHPVIVTAMMTQICEAQTLIRVESATISTCILRSVVLAAVNSSG